MYFQQIPRRDSGCLSYLLGCMSMPQLIVVDPSGEKDDYLSIAEDKGLPISAVIDTHIHADHVSIGPEMADELRVPYYLHETADVQIDFEPLHHGQTLEAGNAHITVLHTPGHSPESVCLRVADLARSQKPAFLLSGDTLLVGDVGRPDLHVDATEGARDLHRSLTERILTLADHLEIFPAHFAGSSCGVGLSPRTSSTLGYEKAVNELLSLPEERFVDLLAGRKVEPPANHQRIVALNRGVAA